MTYRKNLKKKRQCKSKNLSGTARRFKKNYTLKIQIRNILGEIPQNLREQPFKNAKNPEVARKCPASTLGIIEAKVMLREMPGKVQQITALKLKTMNSWSESYLEFGHHHVKMEFKKNTEVSKATHFKKLPLRKCKPKMIWATCPKSSKMLCTHVNQQNAEYDPQSKVSPKSASLSSCGSAKIRERGKGDRIELFHIILHRRPRLSTDQGGIEPGEGGLGGLDSQGGRGQN